MNRILGSVMFEHDTLHDTGAREAQVCTVPPFGFLATFFGPFITKRGKFCFRFYIKVLQKENMT